MNSTTRNLALGLSCLVAAAGPAWAQPPADYFKIRIVDTDSGRGVPLVELRTVNNVTFVTDSNGLVAFYEPALMDQQVFFFVRSHGYRFPIDGFGFGGVALTVVPGGEATIKLQRVNVAERLYRLTGGGIYRDSILLGEQPPTDSPALNAKVLGSDSVVNAVYKDRVYWFWGDTNRPAYPLGNFHVPGATTPYSDPAETDLERGLDLDYFVDEAGFAKETCRMPGPGPTWIDGLSVVLDNAGLQQMFAKYVKIREPMDVYERGMVQWNDEQQQFDKVEQWDLDWPVYPQGHPVAVHTAGRDYLYFTDAIPTVRTLATAEALRDVTGYEAFSCLTSGSRRQQYTVDRDQQGRVRYRWRQNAPPISPMLLAELVQAGDLQPSESFYQLQDLQTGKPILLHRASVYWNDYRQRWVLIGLQLFGSSPLGEIWFAEADTPLGPWVFAAKVVTHDDYSFYNPKQHPMFQQQYGRIIFFEGTYTTLFSGSTQPTPRYNYNQILYRLDLADPRLNLPVPVYRTIRDGLPAGFVTGPMLQKDMTALEIAFFLQPQAADGCVAVVLDPDRGRLVARKQVEGGDQLVGFAPAASGEAERTELLYEHVNLRTGERQYAFAGDLQSPQWLRVPEPLCRAWRSPLQGPLPFDISREKGESTD